jgi:hypothetical protein
MIDVSIHNPVFRARRIVEPLCGEVYCTLALRCDGGSSATLFLQDAGDARALAHELRLISDILSGVTQ